MGDETEASEAATMTQGTAFADTVVNALHDPEAERSFSEVAWGASRFAITRTIGRGGMGVRY